MLQHVAELHAFYGLPLGLGFARKHVTWYLEPLGAGVEFRRFFNALDSAAAQLESLDAFFASPLLTEAAA